MKNHYVRFLNIIGIGCATLMIASSLTSCEDYLNIQPKKQEIPTTLDQFVSLLNHEGMTNSAHAYQTINQSKLMGEYLDAWISYYSPTDFAYINYYLTDGDRYEASSSNTTIDISYRGVAVANQVIDGAAKATECSETQRQSAIASARILRVLQLFHLNSIFARAYDPATADNELSVPIMEHCGLEETYYQPTQKNFFSFLTEELKSALECESLPDFGSTILIPGRGAANAAMARVQLHIRNYAEALKYADEALKINGELLDWVKIFDDNYEAYFQQFNTSRMMTSPLDRECCENYYYATGLGGSPGSSTLPNLELEIKNRFEEGDRFFDCNWQLEYNTGGKFYNCATKGFFNLGGLRSVEQYLIKAECLARLDRTEEACATLNQVRKRYIAKEVYTDFNTNYKDEAIKKIRDFKHSVLIESSVSFDDAKRFNSESQYAHQWRKKGLNEMLEIDPQGRHWTFPLPQSVITNTTYGVVTQIQPD